MFWHACLMHASCSFLRILPHAVHFWENEIPWSAQRVSKKVQVKYRYSLATSTHATADARWNHEQSRLCYTYPLININAVSTFFKCSGSDEGRQLLQLCLTQGCSRRLPVHTERTVSTSVGWYRPLCQELVSHRRRICWQLIHYRHTVY
jgi:hypothetical protein